MDQHDAYYAQLFKHDPVYSTPYPNVEEARRWAAIGEYLSRIAASGRHGDCGALRILDVGCGRGWMTRLASVYGECHGIDPVDEVVAFARTLSPELRFFHGTIEDLLGSPDFEPYDVVLCSEVIEHVEDKEAFAGGLRACLGPGGHVVLTTPRGEQFGRYRRSGYDLQPVEEWITERDLEALFGRHGFRAVRHDRVYDDLPRMSLLHRLAASARLTARLDALGLGWLGKALRHLAAVYQVWWFEKLPPREGATPDRPAA